MADPHLPTAEDLRKLLRYDAETGKLFWQPRPLDGQWSPIAVQGFNRRFAGQEAGGISGNGYVRVGIKWNGTLTKFVAHRVAWCMQTGQWPELFIDHINGDRTDNRMENLREADAVVNGRNRALRVHNKTGVPGCFWHRQSNAYRATMALSDGRIVTRHFRTIEDARRVMLPLRESEGYHDR